MIVVRQTIDVFEVDGKDVALDGQVMEIDSHPENRRWVVVVIGGHSYAVDIGDVLMAGNNATNVG